MTGSLLGPLTFQKKPQKAIDNLDDNYYNFYNKQRYYHSSAKVHLENLAVKGPEVQPTQTIDEDHVQHLINTFHTEGCNNLDPKH